jgi:hypothetical protein
VGTPKDQLKSFSEELTTGQWQTLREGLEVQRLVGTEGQDSYLLCRSAERAAKEQAMRQRFEQRIEQGLQKLQAGCQKRRYKAGVVERRVGRLLARNSRAARLFAVEVVERWRAELQAIEGFRIGIVWQGNPSFPQDRDRSFALGALGVRSLMAHPPTLEQLLLRHYGDDLTPADGEVTVARS